MGAMSIRLPESLHKDLKHVAELEGVSVNQLVAVALAEKVALLMHARQGQKTLEQRREAGKNISREEYLALLAQLPDGEPDLKDAL